MSKHLRAIVVISFPFVLSCAGPVAPTPTTGLTGVVVRGPVTPVCRIDISCDAPFSAGFRVEQNGRGVADFRSDADGRFTVWLAPGRYRVIPNPDAPVMMPSAQSRVVEVGPSGLTQVKLEFDTGIR